MRSTSQPSSPYPGSHPTHTWKWGLDTQRATCLKRGSWIFTNCEGSITSRISSISPRNITWGGVRDTGTAVPISPDTHPTAFRKPSLPSLPAVDNQSPSYLFLGTGFWPVFEQPPDHLWELRQKGVRPARVGPQGGLPGHQVASPARGT